MLTNVGGVARSNIRQKWAMGNLWIEPVQNVRYDEPRIASMSWRSLCAKRSKKHVESKICRYLSLNVMLMLMSHVLLRLRINGSERGLELTRGRGRRRLVRAETVQPEVCIDNRVVRSPFASLLKPIAIVNVLTARCHEISTTGSCVSKCACGIECIGCVECKHTSLSHLVGWKDIKCQVITYA